jgi:biotin carboxyl carrier protein
VRFRDGDHVRAGQVLVDLQGTEQDAAIDQAQSAADLAKLNADRWTTLEEKGIAAKSQADQYRAVYEQARASLAAAKSRRLDRVIRAPFAGVVGLSDVAPGALISPGAVIATLDDVAWAVAHFRAHGGGPLCLLQCTAKYPAPPDAMNLRAIETLRGDLDPLVRWKILTESLGEEAAAGRDARLASPADEQARSAVLSRMAPLGQLEDEREVSADLWHACLESLSMTRPALMPVTPPVRFRDLVVALEPTLDTDALVHPLLIRWCAAFLDQRAGIRLIFWPFARQHGAQLVG